MHTDVHRFFYEVVITKLPYSELLSEKPKQFPGNVTPADAGVHGGER